MTFHPCSRRDFLKLSSMALAAAGLRFPPSLSNEKPLAIGRVTTALIYSYREPYLNSERVEKLHRDQLLNLFEEVNSSKGPSYNPRWYRIKEGFVHSAYIQRIPFRLVNDPLSSIPATGILGEVTVPFTRTFYQGKQTAWQPLYRLYYESVHWIKAVCEGPDGQPWYRLFDPKNDSQYYVPAADLRPIHPSEYSPIAQEVSSADKHIIVSIEEQTLTAYEGEKIVLQTNISSGVPDKEVQEGDIPTDTPIGYWRITQKMPCRHMGNGSLTSQIDAYELPGVPWTMGFHETGASLHGSFWHDNFGHRMSHGCVNMRNSEALWLFRWTDPIFDPSNWYTNGLGTLIQVK
jgi:lipoprotein-anchoring transpeptidase ErfK/SrfK